MFEIVEFFLLPYLPTIPSFVKDAEDCIRRIRNFIDMPSCVLLVTFDVVSLCVSIPHYFSLYALNYFLLDRNLPTIVVNVIHKVTVLVLKKNVLAFIQTYDTAIGT